MMLLDFSPEKRGIISLEAKVYGKSVFGSPLMYYPAESNTELLIIAGIHGEEPETTFLLSRSFRLLSSCMKHTSIILCANPDGMVLGTRANANGVDLNRNFNTSDWELGYIGSKSILEYPQDTVLSMGKYPCSEQETTFLVALINKLKPKSILSMHAPMACLDAPQKTPLVCTLEDVFDLPWKSSIGYKTPGSLGTWCNENKIECVTLELPRLSLEHLYERYGVRFAKFLAR